MADMENTVITPPLITPFLWFDDNAEAAIAFYTSVFKNVRVKNKVAPAGHLLTASLELAGQQLIFLNGGPTYRFNEAISFVVTCATQAEIDYYWEKLTAGGEPSRCGWLKDKFGLSWQIVPTNLAELLTLSDPTQAQQVRTALMQMHKIDVDQLRAAAALPVAPANND